MLYSKFRTHTLTATLIVCTNPAWAVSSLPEYGIVSAAADYLWVDLNNDDNDPFWQLSTINSTSASNQLASISSSALSDDYFASARTTLGNNHAFAQIQDIAFPMGGVANFSGWYDQVTILGGSGTGVAHFTTQIEGMVDVGLFAGVATNALFASSVNPSLAPSIDLLPGAWDLDDSVVTPIYEYTIGISPYNDPALLFTTPLIPATDEFDLVLTPGKSQSLLTSLSGTLTFTYGEPFYLIGGLGTVLSDVLFCDSSTCTPATDRDGIGASTLDFSNSAHLVNIALPNGASASFSSGNTYNVTTVPEPGEWLLMLAGLGLVGWRARRRA